MAKGVIYDIKEFAVHDGPGTRITVFFKGCPLSCNWCHNPEGMDFEPQIIAREALCTKCGQCKKECSHEMCAPFERCIKACPQGLLSISGKRVDSKVLACDLKKNSDFLMANEGGITFSGGEPMAQPGFLMSLLQELKPLHTAIETSGYTSEKIFAQAARLCDLIMFDIKHADTEEHKKYTGVGNEKILRNLNFLIKSEIPFIARLPLIPGVNDTDKNMEQTAVLLKRAKSMIRLEILNYNPYTGAKYKLIGQKYSPKFDEGLKPQIHEDILNRHGIRYNIL